MKPLRVLQVCFVYPPSFSGYGRQLDTVNTALLKDEEALRIEIITGFDGNRIPQPGMRVRALFSRPRTAYASDVRRFYLFCFWLPLRLMFSLPFADVVHAVKAGPDAMITVFMARLFRKKVIVKTAQSEFDRSHPAGPVRRIKRGVILRADAQIAISRLIALDLTHAGAHPERILRIPNAVDVERFRPATPKEKRDIFERRMGRPRRDDEFVFVFLGSITLRKGVKTLLDALASFRPDRAATLILAGPDYREIDGFAEQVRNRATHHPLVDAIYIGEQPAPEDLIRMADCLILPSFAEGMPNVVLEAMACGVPVIGSDIDVNRELIRDGSTAEAHGLLFATGNAGELAERMHVMISGAADRLGESGRQAAKDKYDIAVVAASYRTLYERLAGRGSRRSA